MSRGLLVLHVLEAIASGTARHVTDLVTHVTEVDHVVVTPPERVGSHTDLLAVPAMRAAGADVRIVDMRRSPAAPQNLRALRTVTGLVAELRPDVVHGHSSIGGVIARLAARRVRETPCLWTPNGVLERWPVVAFERGLGRLTDRIVAVSPSERELLCRLRIGRPDRLVMIPNGIELTAFSATPDLRQLCGVPAAALLVGCVARLSEQKGIDVLLDAWQQSARAVPDAHFVLIGSGPLASMVNERTVGWDRFTWLTDLPDARRVLDQLDVFSLLSRYEGGPYAPLEAMWAGVPVVLSDVVGNRDVIDADSGILVPAEDAVGAAAAIVTLLRRPELRRQLGDAGRSRVVHRFDIRKIADLISQLYNEVGERPQSFG